MDTADNLTGSADSIFIAGSPDFCPIEYYDPETKKYEGFLPELLSNISEISGINFIYIYSENDDEKLRLAENDQVEMITQFIPHGSERSYDFLVGYDAILSFSFKGIDYDVCFAYTKIASDDLRSAIQNALDQISDQGITKIAVSYIFKNKPDKIPSYIIIAFSLSTLVLGIITTIFAYKNRKYRNSLKALKMTDRSTGIGNLAYYKEKYSSVLSENNRSYYYLLYLSFDIDWSKKYLGVNGTENLIRHAADTLENKAEYSDILARVNANAFILVHKCISEIYAENKAKELLSLINNYYDTSLKESHTIFKCGIYHLQRNDINSDAALFNAQQGYLYACENKLPYAVCTDEIIDHFKDAAQIRSQILDAITHDEFKIYSQLVVNAKDGLAAGVEALSRWEHPVKGLLRPASYIELIEKANLVENLDYYMFEKVCRQLEEWNNSDYSFLTISCNITRYTISDIDFIRRISEISERYTFEHSRLIIEITEDTLEINADIAYKNIISIKSFGFLISLDDVGSGYTSFTDLRDYPIDIIKIDRQLLLSIDTPKGYSLLKGLIVLAHSMGMKVVCEGIEYAEQIKILEELGCDYLQGFYFSRAIPLEETHDLLPRFI